MEKIAIYGAGAFGQIFYTALGGKIDFFIDDFSNECTYDSIPIKKISEIDKNTKIYISVLQYSKKIEDTLISNGFKNVVRFTDCVKSIPNLLQEIARKNYLWLVEDRSRMLNAKLNDVKKLLKDSKSKKILEQIIMLRKTLDPKYYIDPHDKEYFPSDVPILKHLAKINFIDCGAYTGDSVRDMMAQNKAVNYCISFEPDTNNLHKLHRQFQTLQQQYPKTTFFIYPAGIYSSNKILQFANNGINSSACLNDGSNIWVPVVSLDSVILYANPNYIKMDIEGAEKEAIIGATKTIQLHKPTLAICLYHNPEDLWEIPLLIHTIEPTYDMYIRVHEDMGLSTVLYCIPKKEELSCTLD